MSTLARKPYRGDNTESYIVYAIGGAIVSPECRQLAELAVDKIVLEVGSQHGSSTIAMGKTAKMVVAIDWHQGDDHAKTPDTLAGFWANLKKYGVLDKVVPIVGKFEDVAPMLRPGFEMAFIDAQHYYDDAKRHIRLACTLLKPDGIVAVHDYGWPHFPGVKKAVDELVEFPEIFETLAIFPASAVKNPSGV